MDQKTSKYLAYLTIFVWYADCTAGVDTARGGGVTHTGTVIRLDRGILEYVTYEFFCFYLIAYLWIAVTQGC